MNSNWHNVSKGEPCPVCHKPDWCTVSNDGAMCVCRRIESGRPAKSGYGWVHRIGEVKVKVEGQGQERNCPFRSTTPTPNFNSLHATLDGDAVLRDGMAFGLGLDGAAFAALDVRYDATRECMSFPMRDVMGRITGLRFRHLTTGKKWSAKGSKDGLFYAMSLIPPETSHVFITEGPTDTAAALSLGLPAVGRSSCLSGTQLLAEFVRTRHIRKATILADGDRPGWAGAKRLAAALPIPVRIVLPPPGVKDLRNWYRQGVTRETLLAQS